MNELIELRGLQPAQDPELSPLRRQQEAPEAENSFSDLLTKAIQDVDSSMKESEQAVQSFVAGETENVHDVMISMQRAQVSFQMLTEIRNKAVEAYKEISRMQI